LVLLLDAELKQVRANAAQLEQMVLNLVVNAGDAMQHGGRLTIQTANARLTADQVRGHAGASAGPFVILIVSDTGHGMDQPTQARIFEPFFTTKAQGSGLGLATVYGIIKQVGGFVTVSSEIGKGASFRICLPVTESAEPQNARVSGSGSVNGNETILVVEDEDDVLSLVSQVLEMHGYQVKSARNWIEAFGIAKRLDGGRIHLLLTDVVMPQMSGREIAASIAPLCPGLKVLYMSGYTDAAIVQHGVLEPGVRLLQKPFSPDLLVRMVRDLLDGV
jgi:CheY-like chemotaxis protein